MYYMMEIACVMTEMWMIHMFLGVFFQKRTVSAWAVFSLYAVCGVILTCLSLAGQLVYLRLLFTTVSVLAASMILFKAQLVPGLISGVAFCAIFAVTDIISALAFQMLGVQTGVLMSNHTYRSLYLVTCHIAMFSLIMLVLFFSRNTNKQLSLKTLLPVTPCWLISILLCFLLTWQCFSMNYELHPLFIVVLLGLLYTSITIIHYTNRLDEQTQQKKAWEIAEHHYAMQQEYYDQLRVQQEETRALWHDISKYLRASKIEESNDALLQVQEMLDSISCVVEVNNRVVSVILNEYVQETRTAQIELELDVQVPEELFVTAADLYVLIGNTMDNAIEACQELPVDKRKIVLKLKTHNSILFYEISNPYEEQHLSRARNLYHGFGLKNVARCVEKYGGKMELSKDSGIFRISAHMNSV